MEVYESIALLRIRDRTRAIVDEKLLAMMHAHDIEMDAIALQVMLSDWENSNVKVVWLNNFEARFGFEFCLWISLALARTINDERYMF